MRRRVLIGLVTLLLFAACDGGSLRGGDLIKAEGGSSRATVVSGWRTSFGEPTIEVRGSTVILDRAEPIGTSKHVVILGMLLQVDDEQKEKAFWTNDCGFPPLRIVTHRIRGYELRPGHPVALITGVRSAYKNLGVLTVATGFRLTYHKKDSKRLLTQEFPFKVQIKLQPEGARNELCDVKPEDRIGRIAE